MHSRLPDQISNTLAKALNHPGLLSDFGVLPARNRRNVSCGYPYVAGFGFGLLLMMFSFSVQGQINFTWAYGTSGTGSMAGTTNSTVATAGNASEGNGVTAAYELTSGNPQPSRQVNDFSVALSTAVTNNEYVQYTLTTGTCGSATLANFSLDYYRQNNNAPNAFEIRVSTNGFSNFTVLNTIATATTSNSTAFTTVSGALSSSVLVPANTTLTIRLYGYGANMNNSNQYIQLDNVVFSGTETVTPCNISGPATVCSGSTANIYSTSAGSSYAWSISGNGTINGSTASQLAVADAGSAGTFTVTAMVTNGSCVSSCSQSVTVNASATAEAGGPYSTCGSTPVAISATANGSGSWSGGVGLFSDPNSMSTVYTPDASEIGKTVFLTWTTNDPDGAGPCAAVSDVATVAAEGQEIEVKGNGIEIVSGDNTPEAADYTDFGWTMVSSGTITRSFVIENTGTNSLYLDGAYPVTITGANAGDFTVTLQPASPVMLNGGVSIFDIQFDPSAPGMRTATVNIANHDCDESLYTFDIQAKGTDMQAISVFGNGQAIANRESTTNPGDNTDFGAVSTGGGSVTHSFSIQNVNNGAPLHLDGSPIVTIADRDATDFTVVAQPASLVDGGTNASFEIKFQPGAKGLRTAIVIITTDDMPQNSFVFTINGTGL